MQHLFKYFFFGMPHLAILILFLFTGYVIASIAYTHPVYGRIQTHNLLVMSLLPYPLDQASRLCTQHLMKHYNINEQKCLKHIDYKKVGSKFRFYIQKI